MKLPEDSGRINKLSFSYLYCALVCLVLRDISPGISIGLGKQHDIDCSRSVCVMYHLAKTDLRDAYSVCRYFEIMGDSARLGYRGASVKHEVLCTPPTCVRCKKNGRYTMMDVSDQSPTGFLCLKCGCTERVARRMLTKHLRNLDKKVTGWMQDFLTYAPPLSRRSRYLLIWS